jgi:hypothetical protein
MLPIHGARAVLRSAVLAGKKGDPLDRARQWALDLLQREPARSSQKAQNGTTR